MTYKRWEELKGDIQDRFDVIEDGREDFDQEEGGGFLEFVVFGSDMGEIKLELEVKPLITGHKVFTGRRAGAGTKETFTYSEDEFSTKLFVLRWSEELNDWEELDAENVGAIIQG